MQLSCKSPALETRGQILVPSLCASHHPGPRSYAYPPSAHPGGRRNTWASSPTSLTPGSTKLGVRWDLLTQFHHVHMKWMYHVLCDLGSFFKTEKFLLFNRIKITVKLKWLFIHVWINFWWDKILLKDSFWMYEELQINKKKIHISAFLNGQKT